MDGTSVGRGILVPDIRGDVAARVRAERARKGISQEELAHRSGLSRMHIGSIERGTTACSINTLAQIAVALGVPVRELLPETIFGA